MLLIKIEDDCVVPQKSVRDYSRDSCGLEMKVLEISGRNFFKEGSL